jgi:alpha-tubulin suppressor-like RCC1 family protein
VGLLEKVAKIVLASNAMITTNYAFSYILDTDGNVWATGYNSGQLGTGETPNLNTFTKIRRATNGAKAVDIKAMGYGAASGFAAVITQDDGTMMAVGNNSFGQTGTDAGNNTNIYNFKYVMGFGPGQNASQFSGGLVPFNLLTGAQLGNVVDNLDFTQQFNWSTASNTNALVLSANSLTSGSLQTLTTNSTGFTGSLLSISSTGDSASSTGSLINLNVVGANSSSTALKITNAGTGLSVDVTGGLALRAGSDFSAAGVTNNAPFGNASLIRLTGISAQTFTGIAGGTNGLLLTLMNAGVATTTLQNDNGASTVGNRIITGTGADLEVKAGGSIMLQYDGTSAVWRVIGGTGSGSAGVTYLATSSQNFIPVLMNEESQFGMPGQAFIYRNQIYTMGYGAANRPYGINGDTNTANAATPTLLPIAATTSSPNGPSGWSQIVGNENSACALSNIGTVYCWGDNVNGELGTGDLGTDHQDARMVPFPGGATAITKLFTNHSQEATIGGSYFAIDTNGKVWAWGDNSNGVLGVGDSSDRGAPVAAGGAPWSTKSIKKISISTVNGGGPMAAAVDTDGQLYTWGYNNLGQLGIATSDVTQRSTPVAISNLATSTVDVIVRGGYDGATFRPWTLALKADGTVWGAGDNSSGQLGLGDTTFRQTFQIVTSLNGINVAKIYGAASDGATGGFAAVVSTTGRLYTSGYNGHGQLGLGDTTNRNTFQLVNGAWDTKVTKVVVFGSNDEGSTGSMYILDNDGNLYSTGYNGGGQLGLGTTASVSTPRKVLNTGGARVLDMHGFGTDNQGGITVVLDNGSMMSAGYNTFNQAGNDVQNVTYNSSLKYVVGFEPGSKNSAVGLGTLIPFNLLSGAVLGNLLDNLNFTQQWNWSTASTSDAMVMSADQLTTGSLLTGSSASGAFSGNLVDLTVSGDTASTTGNVLSLNVTGVNSSSTALKINTVGGGLAMDITGMVAFRNGFNFSTNGASHNVDFGNTSLVRMTGTGPQIISGIARGVDGAILTIMNTGTSTATTTLQNQNGSSLAANRIITGFGADLQIAGDQSVMLQYDASVSRWRVISGGTSGSATYITQTLATSTVSIIPKLMDASAGTGQVGNTIIYRNQIYTMGAGFAGLALTGGPAAYGVNGDTNSNMGGSNAYSPTLVPVQNPPSGWSSVVGNYSSVCALSNVGTVYCWGHNSQGQLGDGTTNNNFIARQVNINSNTRPIVAIYTNSNYGLNTSNATFWAIDDQGDVWAWGDNAWGQIGNGVVGTDAPSPVQSGSAALSGINIVKLSVSSTDGTHVAAISDTGALYTWGANGTNGSNGGQLGLGTSGAPVATPSLVPGMTSGVVDVVAKSQSNILGFTVVLKNNGTVWTAGSNNNGVAGIGTEDTNLLSFTQSNSLGANFITKIFANDTSNGGNVAAVNASGTVFFSGYNAYGNLGTNDTTQRLSYTQPTGAFQGKVSKVVMGGSGPGNQIYNYILTTDGQIWSAGDNAFGQLGQGGTTDSTTFQKIIGPGDGSKFIDVRAFGYDEEAGGIAVMDNGSIMSWGNNVAGAAGNDINSKQVESATAIVYEYSGTSVENGLNSFSGVPRYVIGFEPGSKQNQLGGSLIPFSTLYGAISGNAIDNANWTQNWQWSTASDTNALVMSANNLSSGNLQSLTTNSTLFTGSLLSLTSSGNATTTTGSLANLTVTGASSTATGLKISNGGTGLAMDIASGAIAFRKGADYITTGTTNDAPFANSSLIRLNGATAQTITGIANGADGKLLTLMNVGAATATLSNQSVGSAAGNRIITGLGIDLLIPVDGSVLLTYDSGASRWRVISGGTGNSIANGTTNIVQITASSTSSNVQLMSQGNSGMYGQMFIYNNQLYSMGGGGNSVAGWPYGDAAVVSHRTPQLVSITGTTPTGWAKVVGNHYNVCAISNVGEVYCMGEGSTGGLGDGTATTRYSMTKVTFPINAGPITNIVTMNDFRDTSTTIPTTWHAIDSNGKVFGWGYNSQGQVGNGTSGAINSPVQVGDAAFQAKTIVKVVQTGASGDTSTSAVGALASDGTLYTWGYNNQGNLGLGNTTTFTTPQQATTSVADVAMAGSYDGNDHKLWTVIAKTDGTVWSAGNNESGVLANGTQTNNSTFQKAQGLTGVTITKVYAGTGNVAGYAFAQTADGYVYSVGNNSNGVLGWGGTTVQTSYGLPTGSFQGKVAKVVLSGTETNSTPVSYILTTDGQLWVAGYNGTGAFGIGNTTSPATGFQQTALNTNGAKIIDVRSVGNTSNIGTTIALDNGTMMSAGLNYTGQLGLDVQDANNVHNSFKYVVGFEPGARGQSLSGSNILPFLVNFNNLTGLVSSSTLDNLANTLTYAWSALTTQVGFNMNANSLTSGTILDVTSSSTALNSTNGLFAVRNLGTTTAGMLASFVASSTNSNGLYIKNNGTVGIGTSSPSAMLDLYNSSSTILALNVTGAVAFKAGADFATSTAVANNVNFGNASLIRVNATTSAFLGISGIADLTGASTTHVGGRLLTIMNASSTSSFTLFNQSTQSSQNNRIITGTGADLVLAADATVLVQYDSTAARWRVVGGSGSGGGSTAAVQTVTASTTLAGWNRIAKVSPSSTGSITVTLPTAVGFTGQTIQVINVSSSTNSVVVVPSAGQTINGNANVILTQTNDSVVLTSDGSNVLITSDSRSSVGSTISYLQGYSSTSQTTNLTAGTSHFMFDTVEAYSGTDISLDTSTPYSNTAGAASLGRITLKAGKTYKLYADAGALSGTNPATYIAYQWYNADTGVAIGQTGSIEGSAEASNDALQAKAEAVFTPTVDTKVEIRLTVKGADTLGIGNSAYGLSRFNITTLSTPQPITQSADYIFATPGTLTTTTNADVPFTVQQGNMAYASNLFTLQAGKTYELEAQIGGTNGSADFQAQVVWKDASGTNLPGQAVVNSAPQTSGLGYWITTSNKVIYTPTVNTQVKVNVSRAAGLGTVGVNQGFVSIKQIGATTQTTSSIALQGGNALNTTMLLGSLDANALAFMSSSTERMRLTAQGAFLFGTTTPTLAAGTAAWFNIVGSSTFATSSIFRVASGTGLTLFEVGHNGNIRIGTSTVNGFMNLQASASTSPIFTLASSTGANVMRIGANGFMSVGGLATSTARLTVSNSTTTVQNAMMNTVLHVIGDTSTTTSVRLVVDSFNINGSSFIGRQARGNGSAPAQTQTGDGLATFGGVGYGQTGYASTTRGSFNVKAASTWTDIAQATYLTFETTGTSSITSTERMRINADGSLSVGTTTIAGGFNYQAIATSSNIFSIASSTGANVFTISAAGGVGIGTSTNIFGGSLTSGLTLNNALVLASSTAISTTTFAIYNKNGTLFWNGAALNSSVNLAQSFGSILTALVGSSTGYTSFSGGIGTGGVDSQPSAQRITNSGNLVNIGNIQNGGILSTAGGTFSSATGYGIGSPARSMSIGDLNGDGNNEILTSNNASNTMTIYWGNGTGLFTASTTLTTATGPVQNKIGDLNGDGRPDIVVNYNSSAQVSVFLNVGGTFPSRTEYVTGSSASVSSGTGHIGIGDLNGDGRSDLVVPTGSTLVSVLMNKGDGTFAAKVDYTNPHSAVDVVLGDFNGDGKADMVAGTGGHTNFSVRMNNGDGTFGAATTYTAGVSTVATALAAADLNNDGSLDIAVQNTNGTTVSVFLNTGNGTFAPKVEYTSSDGYGLTIADMNGDGFVDLVPGSYSTPASVAAVVLYNNGNGTFAPRVTIGSSSGYTIAAGDLNNDGKPDIVTGSFLSNTISVLLSAPRTMIHANAYTGLVSIGTSTATSSSNALLYIANSSSTSATDLFKVASSSGANILTISSGGNVGVGTTTINSALSIQGATGASLLSLNTTAGANALTVNSVGRLSLGTTSSFYASEIALAGLGSMRLSAPVGLITYFHI